MTGDDVKAMMLAVAQAIIDNVDVLSEADRATGDGDHGVGMRRGFEAAQDATYSVAWIDCLGTGGSLGRRTTRQPGRQAAGEHHSPRIEKQQFNVEDEKGDGHE